MTLVPAKCPECGKNVVVDSEKDAWICDFCKMPFVVEKAINHFRAVNSITNNVINNNDIKADVVDVFETKEKGFIIRAGVLEKYVGESDTVRIPEHVTAIGGAAFYGCEGIKAVSIPDGVEEIKDGRVNFAYTANQGAFVGCYNLSEVKMPRSLKKIGIAAFYGCDKAKFIFSENYCSEYSSLSVGAYAFSGCSKLEIMPYNLLQIGEKAFYSCSSLKQVHFDKSLSFISKSSFHSSGIEEIILPDNLKGIEELSFAYCKNLKTLIINKNIETIGKNFIMGCGSLDMLDLPEGDFKFAEQDNLKLKRSITEKLNKKTNVVFSHLNNRVINQDELIIDNGVKKIGKEAFRGRHYKKVVLPETIEEIEMDAFYACRDLESINIPDRVKLIWNSAFDECTSLKDVDIKNDTFKRLLTKAPDLFYGTPYRRCREKNICPYCNSKLSITGKCKNSQCKNHGKKVFG